MTPAERLTVLLESLPSEQRREITAWLPDRHSAQPSRSWVTLSSGPGRRQR